MLVDILNSANYIMVNRAAVELFGINAAIYCSELLNIFKKATRKNKLYNETYFKVDRDYIQKQTSITVEEQLKCDLNLAKPDVGVLKISTEDPNIICFDVERYASLLSCEDIKLLSQVSKKAKVDNPKGAKQKEKEYITAALKESIECRTPEVLFALCDWIDAVMAVKVLSKPQVKIFKDTLDDYCEGDLQKALDIIKIATVHQYQDCQWAINLYEKGNKPSQIYIQPKTSVRITEQKISTELGTEEF